ncbi:hypothetical protein Leryth_004239 [Lithospermum erythrorhizon]|nr:hypothetical protein Leryth_004239 [Lithospermum erythrorhizon]
MRMQHNPYGRRRITKSVKWFKHWVSHDVVGTGGQCRILKWVNEASLKAIEEKNEQEVHKSEPEATTEVLFLCNYEGCGITFIDAGALRKHSQMHGERQYICQYEGCGKKFPDGSKLKRHFLAHTEAREFICPHEGSGKAFSLDFNLREHMRTHSRENYHTCPYAVCGKRYDQDYKLKKHIAALHQKDTADSLIYTPPAEKPQKTPKSAGVAYGSAASIRPYECPFDGCEKSYIHAYKLNLHLRREHPGNCLDGIAKNAQPSGYAMDEGSDQDAFIAKFSNTEVHTQSSRTKPGLKQPPSKVARLKGSSASPANPSKVKKPFPEHEKMLEEEERDNYGGGWRYRE